MTGVKTVPLCPNFTMEQNAKKFLINLGIFSFAMLIIAAVLYSTLLKEWYFPMAPAQFLLILLVTGISHLWLQKSILENKKGFTAAFMLTVSIKLMVYLAFIVICLLIDRSHAIVFVLTFFLLYICFTIFEVKQILGCLKKQSTQI